MCLFIAFSLLTQGVNPGIIPFLEPEYVANKVIEAVLTNQKVLMLPRIMYILYALKGLVFF